MMDEPNSRDGRYQSDSGAFDDLFPPELQALAQRLSADESLWLSQLPDPMTVAERIRAIPATHPRTAVESEHMMSSEIQIPSERGTGAPRNGGQPPHSSPQRGLLAALAAVVIVALLAFVFIALAQRSGATTGPVGQPTPTETQPAATPTATEPAPTATTTTAPTGSWTEIVGYTAGGNYTTSTFNVTSPWRIVWQCNRSMGNVPTYSIKVSASPASGGGATPVLDVVCQEGNTSGTSGEITAPNGNVYLTVTSGTGSEWDLRVQVLR